MRGQVARLGESISEGMRKLEAGTLQGAALTKVEAKVLADTEERLRLQADLDNLPVRRRPTSGAAKKRGKRGGSGLV